MANVATRKQQEMTAAVKTVKGESSLYRLSVRNEK